MVCIDLCYPWFRFQQLQRNFHRQKWKGLDFKVCLACSFATNRYFAFSCNSRLQHSETSWKQIPGGVPCRPSLAQINVLCTWAQTQPDSTQRCLDVPLLRWCMHTVRCVCRNIWYMVYCKCACFDMISGGGAHVFWGAPMVFQSWKVFQSRSLKDS